MEERLDLQTQKYKADCRWSNEFITAIGARVRPTLQESVRIGLFRSQGDESGLVFSLAKGREERQLTR